MNPGANTRNTTPTTPSSSSNRNSNQTSETASNPLQLTQAVNPIIEIEPIDVQKRNLEAGLDAWINDETISSDQRIKRERAAEVIRTATTELNLSNRKLTTLPKEIIQNLPGLTVIDLSKNKLDELDGELLSRSRYLIKFSAKNNVLTAIPEALFRGTPQLQTVNFQVNNLRDIPSGLFENTPRLRDVQFDETTIESIPSELFRRTPELQTINLNDNELTELPADLLSNTANLTTFLIGSNQLSMIPEGFFSRTPELQEVDFYGNLLTQLPEDLFANTTKLINAQFPENPLISLPAGLFRSTPELERACFESDALTRVSPEVFNPLNSGCEIDLEGNPLTAETVRELTMWLNSRNTAQRPQILLSIGDNNYTHTVGLGPEDLKSKLALWNEETPRGHALWNVLETITQRPVSEKITDFVIFLARLWNESPQIDGEHGEELRINMEFIVLSMEKEFETKQGNLNECEFIKNILLDASRGVGTCIDKIKVGFVLMQLHMREYDGEEDVIEQLNQVEATIDLISDINTGLVVWDNQQRNYHRITLPEAFSETTSLLDQTFFEIMRLNENQPDRYELVRIGDETEDILALIYADPEIDVCKVDMRFESCCTLRDEKFDKAFELIQRMKLN